MRKTVDFFFELGQLKRVKRSGWWIAGVKDPETVAEHSFRTAAIGYVLAGLEGADERKVMLSCLFNDLHEARINDLHKVGHRYIDFKRAETKAFSDAVERLPKAPAKELRDAFAGFQLQDTKEGIVARDADLLECALQAKEYLDIGHADAKDWIDNVRKLLRTRSAKEMLNILSRTSPSSWWKGLKKIER